MLTTRSCQSLSLPTPQFLCVVPWVSDGLYTEGLNDPWPDSWCVADTACSSVCMCITCNDFCRHRTSTKFRVKPLLYKHYGSDPAHARTFCLAAAVRAYPLPLQGLRLASIARLPGPSTRQSARPSLCPHFFSCRSADVVSVSSVVFSSSQLLLLLWQK